MGASRSWRKHVGPLLLLGALAALFFWRPLFGGHVLAPVAAQRQMEPWRSEMTSPVEAAAPRWEGLFWDAAAQFIPWRIHYARTMRQGELPLWNPYQFCGMPFLANAQSAVLYPPNLLYLVVPPLYCFGLLAALHVWLAGACTYLFVCRLGTGRAPALLSGVAFAFGGFLVTWAELPTLVAAAAWLPFCFLFAHRLLAHRSWCDVVGLGAGGALAVLAGHPQIAIYVVGTTALYVAARLLAHALSSPLAAELARLSTRLAVSAALLALLPMAQVLPTAELGRESHRSAAAGVAAHWGRHYRSRLAAAELPSLVMPDYFGTPANGTSAVLVYSEHCGYFGAVALGLALLGPVLKRARHTWFFSALLLGCLLVALGTPVARLLLTLVPPLAAMGSFTRLFCVFVFAGAILAGLAAQGLAEAIRERRGATMGLAAAVAPGALVFWCLVRWFQEARVLAEQLAGVPAEEFVSRQMSVVWSVAAGAAVWGVAALVARARHAPALVPAVALTVTAAELFVWGMGFNPTGPRRDLYAQTQSIRALRDVAGGGRILGVSDRDGWRLRSVHDVAFPPNSALVYGLRDVQGYDSLHTMRYRRFAEALEGAGPCPQLNGNLVMLENVRSPLLAMAGGRWLLSAYPLDAPNLRARGGWIGARLYENTDALPRAFVGAVDVVGEGPDVPAGLAAAARRLLGDVRGALITTDGVNRVVVRAQARPDGSDTHLVLTDALLPGWRAFVDGEEAPLQRAYYLFRAVPLSPGEHTVEFVYVPESFCVGLFLSLVGVALAAGCLGWSSFRATRTERHVLA